MKTVRTEEELATAMKNEEPMIEIVGDLANKTIKIKATGSFAWGIAFAAIGVAVGMAMTGVGLPAAVASAGVATAFLGTGAVSTAIVLGVAAGGAGILSSLRDDYKILEKGSGRVILKRR